MTRWSLHLLALACVLLVCAPVLTGNWVGGHEGYSYLWRTAEVRAQLGAGTLWPRWCPDFYWGYGYPFFVFYPPGVFVGAAVLGFGGLWWGLGAMAALGSAALFYGTRRLALLFAGEAAARTAAVLATLATYRFVQLWVRGDYAESVATGLVPWVLADAVVLRRGPPDRASTVAAGARLAMLLGLVCLTHTLTAVMLCGALLVMGLGPALLRVGVPSLAGLVLSAGYWLPVFAHRRLVRFTDMVDPVEGSVSYHWADHFPTLWQRVSPAFGFGDSVPGPADGMAMSTSLAGWAIVGAALVLFARGVGRQRLRAPLAAWLGVQALLLPVSTPLWEWLPGLRMFQFPWRFLLLDAVLVALLGAVVVDLLARRAQGLPSWAPAAATGALAAILALPAAYGSFQHALTEPFPLDERGHAALAEPERIATLGAFSEATKHIPITTAGRNEYLPRTVTAPPRQHPASRGAPPLPRDLGPHREQAGAWRRWQVRVPADGRYEVSWFHFPGVRARVDGQETEVHLSDGRGVVALDLAAGEQVVEVRYSGTAAMHAGEAVGALGWVGALVALGWARRRDAATLSRSASS